MNRCPLADEILVADSLSTDGSLEIVPQMGGCRIVQREFVDYADFKNWAIPQARYPWVLIVDADERLTDELASEIRQLLSHPPASVDGYFIYRRNYYLGHEIKHCGWNTDRVCRLIRRNVCRYRACRVHEEIAISRKRSRKLRGKLLHYVYRNLDDYFAKRLRYTKLSTLDAWDQGRRTGVYGLLLRPLLRFVQLYFFRLGFLDGLAGIQVCMLTAFFNTLVRQARLWEMEHGLPQADTDPDEENYPVSVPFIRRFAEERKQLSRAA